jgi:hypothetical protein
MKIAIDLRAMQIGHQYRGIGSYLNNVLSRFPFDTSGHQYVFLRYDSTNPIKDMNLPIKEYDEIILSKPKKPSSNLAYPNPEKSRKSLLRMTLSHWY